MDRRRDRLRSRLHLFLFQKKSQSARPSELNIFGIDVFRDVLRAVTGSPRDGIEFKRISGNGPVFSFRVSKEIKDLPKMIDDLSELYEKDHYKDDFSWVDNIRQVQEKSLKDTLDESLLEAIKKKNDAVVITAPEIVEWDNVVGFSCTRRKGIATTVDTLDYLGTIKPDKVSVASIKRDRLIIHPVEGDLIKHSMYKCIYFEVALTDYTYILSDSVWYEISGSFINRINSNLDQLDTTDIDFPPVKVWSEQKNGEMEEKIEHEKNYNIRASELCGFHLLDRKPIKSNKTTTSIELLRFAK